MSEDFDFRADAEKFLRYYIRASQSEPLTPHEAECLAIAEQWLALYDTENRSSAAIGALVARATATDDHGSVAYELALHIQLWVKSL